ncbi:facilitated trehalose transporter Tret1-like [Drosophila takahashii]|uniref:facilitated trehalose transporter Tret1-like n=1 Tax=Drosophila takahashii TaxID=29030 RepID=UPI001CF7F1F6|nr:facilitated trehalose transporter Tret1-like [Drosophila takahashii]
MVAIFENSLLRHKTRYQLLATVIVNIITFGHGVGVGWLSPTLTKIQTPDSPLDFEVNLAEISWLGSMLGLGSLCGNLTIALLIERAGRKFCIYLLAGPYACIWILIYCASNVYFLYAARFLCGFTGGAGYVVVPIFISEIADSSIRGALTSMVMLSVDLGILAGYILSTYLAYHVVPFLAIILPVAYFMANIMLPETAPYLLKKSQLSAAENSFRYYRNQRDAICEQTSKVNFEELRSAVLAQQNRNATPLSYRDLITKPALKGFAASIVLSLGYQFSGVFSFINYMSDIFKASGSIVDVNTATIIIGIVQIVGVYTSTILVDIVGRRVLMLISTLGVGIGCIAFGCFTYFAESHDLTDYNWLPLVLMIFICYVANIGLIGIFFLVLVELFPVKIRSLATSLSVIFLSVLVFGTLKLFPLMLHYWGISITMWFSAASGLLTFLYFWLFLQETKGKSMIED